MKSVIWIHVVLCDVLSRPMFCGRDITTTFPSFVFHSEVDDQATDL